MGKKRYYYLDVIKIMATFCVIGIHTIPSFMHTENIGLNIFYDSVMSLMHTSVILFMMITGALLLGNDREYTFKDMFNGYIKRTCVYLAVFGTLFSMLEIFVTDRRIDFLNGFLNMLTGKSWDHLWYLYMLIGLYIIVPVIKPFIKTVGKSQIIVFLAILYVFNVLIPVFENITGMDIGFYIPFLKPNLFYFVLGFYMMKYYEENNKIMYNIFALVFSFVVMAILAIDKHYNANATAEFLMTGNLTSPVLTIVAFNIFAIYKKCGNKIKESRLSNALVPHLFMIYLIHPVFIHFFNRVVTIDSVILSSPPVCLVVIVMAFIISAVAAKAINSVTGFVDNKIKNR